MTIVQLKIKLSKHGNIQIIKEGVVFTLLLTGEKLSNAKTVQAIQQNVLEYAGEKYPLIEAIRNDESFFCMILAPQK